MGSKYQSMSDLSEAQKRSVYYYINNSNSFPDLKTRTEEAGYYWNKKGSTSDRDMRASKSGAISLFKSDISKSGYGFKDYSTGFSALNIIDFQIYLDSNGTATNGSKNDQAIREKAVDNIIKDYGLTMRDLLDKVFVKANKNTKDNISKFKSRNKRDVIKNQKLEKPLKVLGDEKSYNEKNKEFQLNKYRVDPKTKEDIYKLNVMSKQIKTDPSDKNQRIGMLKNYTYDAKKMTPREPAWQYLKQVRRLSDDMIDKYKDSMLSVKLWDGSDGIAFLGKSNGKIYTAEIKNFDKTNRKNFKYNKSGDNFAPFEYIKDKDKKIDTLFFVEGAIDAMSLDESLKYKENVNYGIIATGGTGNLIKAVEDSLKNLNVDINDITLAMDNDRAGMDAVKTYMEHFNHVPNLSFPYNMLDKSSYGEAIRLGLAEIDPNKKDEIKVAKDFNDFLVTGRKIMDLINKGANLSFTSMKKCYINSNYDSIKKVKDKHFEKVLDNISKKTGLTVDEIDKYLQRNNNAGYFKKIILPKQRKEEPIKDQRLEKDKEDIVKKQEIKKENIEKAPNKESIKKEVSKNINKEISNTVKEKPKQDKANKRQPEERKTFSKPLVQKDKALNKKEIKDRPATENKNVETKKEKKFTREELKEILNELNSKPLFVLKAKDSKGKDYKSFVSLKDLLNKEVGYNFKACFKPYGLEKSESIALLDKLNSGSFLLQHRKEEGSEMRDAFMQIDLDLNNRKINVSNLESPKEFNHSDKYKGYFIEDVSELYSDGTLLLDNVFSENFKNQNEIKHDKNSASYLINLKNNDTTLSKIQGNEINNNLKNKDKIFTNSPLFIHDINNNKLNFECTKTQSVFFNNKNKNYFKDIKMNDKKGEIKTPKGFENELDKVLFSENQREKNQNLQR